MGDGRSQEIRVRETELGGDSPLWTVGPGGATPQGNVGRIALNGLSLRASKEMGLCPAAGSK